MAIERFVDAHMHLWDLDHLAYPWLTPPFRDGPNGITEPIASTYRIDDYRREAGRWNLAGCVHVEAGAHPSHAVAETRWLAAVAAADPDGWPSAIVANAPLDAPDLDAILEVHAACPRVRGIRDIANWHPDPTVTYNARDKLEDPRWRGGYARLARHGFSFDLQVYPSQMADAASLAAAHPATTMIVDHCGMPVGRDADAIADWRGGIARLAAQANVRMKLSGLGMSDRRWTIASLRPFILELIEAFGTGRCMFASNFPTDRLYGSFDRHLEAYDAIASEFSPTDRAALFADTAGAAYRLA